ncbi:MAG: hypothetical protein LLG04_00915 [Parachlamydia sp.]|nr:hypothetical protein [Parachlamydia sp.]
MKNPCQKINLGYFVPMNGIRDFIKKYLAGYLAECQMHNPFIEGDQYSPYPPTSQEIEELILYLQHVGVDPVIAGTIALVKHLNLTSEDIHARDFRPTHKLEVLISKTLPNPPKQWQLNKESEGSWISPKGGVVEFLMEEDALKAPNKVGRDPESVKMGCPVTDVQTIFKMKLNSDWEKDLAELMTLTRKVGIPNDIDNKLWNSIQRKNLNILKFWAKLRLNNEAKIN